MKTLDEIIKRNDYVRVTKQLRERAHELSEIILRKIVELDCAESTMCFNGHSYEVHTLTSNVSSEDFLCVQEFGDFDGDMYVSHYNLHGRKGYMHGDFNCPLKDASNAMYRDFLNDCRDILAWLDHIESKKVTECEQALKNAEGLK